MNSKLGEIVANKEKLVQMGYPREVCHVTNGIKHLAKGNTRKGPEYLCIERMFGTYWECY